MARPAALAAFALLCAAACGVKGPPRPPRATAAARADAPAPQQAAGSDAPDAGCTTGCREAP